MVDSTDAQQVELPKADSTQGGGENGKASKRVLIPQAEIARRITVLSGFVEKFDPHVAVAVPIASFVFAADLLRTGTLHKLPLYFLNVLGHEGDDWRIVTNRQLPDIAGARVLLIESCRDSGHTLAKTKSFLAARGANQIMSLVAVDKNQPDCVSKCSGSLFKMDGLSNPYIFGYGMDAKDGTGRGLRDIWVEQ